MPVTQLVQSFVRGESDGDLKTTAFIYPEDAETPTYLSKDGCSEACDPDRVEASDGREPHDRWCTRECLLDAEEECLGDEYLAMITKI